MKPKPKKSIFVKCVLFFMFFTLSTHAQNIPDTLLTYQIKLIDGNEFYGNIISETTDSIYISTINYGRVAINKLNIKTKRVIDNKTIKDGEIWDENTQCARYFWAPNGYGLKKGEGYYQNVWVLYNQASYGINKYFSVGGGILPLFLFDATPTPIFVTPKVSVPIITDKLNVGAGFLLGTIVGEPQSTFALPYLVATIGSKDINFTIGSGWGYLGDTWAKSPVLQFGALVRMSRKAYFITENYFFKPENENIGIMIIGGRTVWQRVSVDYGLAVPVYQDIDGVIAIPWLGIVVPF